MPQGLIGVGNLLGPFFLVLGDNGGDGSGELPDSHMDAGTSHNSTSVAFSSVLGSQRSNDDIASCVLTLRTMTCKCAGKHGRFFWSLDFLSFELKFN